MVIAPSSDRPVPWEKVEPCADWHGDLQRAFAYWRAVHPADGLPGRQHIQPMDIVPLLPFVWLLDVQHAPFRLRHRLVGTRIVDFMGQDPTGQWMDDAHPEIGITPDFFARYAEVVGTRIPSWRRGRPRLGVHRDFVVMENLLLPLARDGREVDMLLALTVPAVGAELSDVAWAAPTTYGVGPAPASPS